MTVAAMAAIAVLAASSGWRCWSWNRWH